MIHPFSGFMSDVVSIVLPAWRWTTVWSSLQSFSAYSQCRRSDELASCYEGSSAAVEQPRRNASHSLEPVTQVPDLLIINGAPGDCQQPSTQIPMCFPMGTTIWMEGILGAGLGRGELDNAEPKVGGFATSRPALVYILGETIAALMQRVSGSFGSFLINSIQP